MLRDLDFDLLYFGLRFYLLAPLFLIDRLRLLTCNLCLLVNALVLLQRSCVLTLHDIVVNSTQTQ